jgi:osmotically-inducible protein OsmY
MAHRGQAAPEPDAYLCERVREALARDQRSHELDVQVAMVAGRLVLTGTVATPQRRAAIVEVVREVLPGYEIHDATTVGPHPETPDAEEVS